MVVIIHYLEKAMEKSQQKAEASIRARDLVYQQEGEKPLNFLRATKGDQPNK